MTFCREEGAGRSAATRPPFVDAHLHLWNRAVLRYPWLEAPDRASIAAPHGVADHRAAAAGWNLVGAVHVEAGAHPDDAARETDWLNGIADETGLPDAIVAHAELHAPGIDERLARLAGQRRVVGVRHIVNWHPDPARRACPRDLTIDPAWRRGYGALADHGLSCDFHGLPPQLAGLAETAARHPAVPLVVNHLGLPILADGLAAWRAGMAALAAMPQVSVKLSGAGFVHVPFDPAAFADIVHEVVDRFGTKRVMIASNYPTDRLFAPLDTILAAYESLLAKRSDDERADLWGRTANRVYRLELPL